MPSARHFTRLSRLVWAINSSIEKGNRQSALHADAAVAPGKQLFNDDVLTELGSRHHRSFTREHWHLESALRAAKGSSDERVYVHDPIEIGIRQDNRAIAERPRR